MGGLKWGFSLIIGLILGVKWGKSGTARPAKRDKVGNTDRFACGGLRGRVHG